MSTKINVVIDTSGSMVEDDKNAVVRYVLYTICGLRKKDCLFEFYQIGADVKKIENIEKEKLEFKGSYNAASIDKLVTLIDNDAAILFISDGNLESGVKSKLQSLENDIVPVWIGMDANISCLESIAVDKEAYSVPDIAQAVSSIL